MQKKVNLNILLGITGSVASIRTKKLVDALGENHNVKIIPTDCSKHFIKDLDLDPKIIICDSDEWNSWKTLGDPVIHIDLVKWADIFLIAPITANTLGKLASGICDNLLLSVARAWGNPSFKPFAIAPAMNTAMWEHPITREHLKTIHAWGIGLIPPVKKMLACGDYGEGGIADLSTLVDYVSSQEIYHQVTLETE